MIRKKDCTSVDPSLSGNLGPGQLPKHYATYSNPLLLFPPSLSFLLFLPLCFLRPSLHIKPFAIMPECTWMNAMNVSGGTTSHFLGSGDLPRCSLGFLIALYLDMSCRKTKPQLHTVYRGFPGVPGGFLSRKAYRACTSECIIRFFCWQYSYAILRRLMSCSSVKS